VTISKSVQLAAAASAGLVAALAIWWFHYRGASAAKLAEALPDKPGATLFIDAGQARRAGFLRHLSAPPETQESDYRAFVEATGFDFTRDLDRLMVRFGAGGGVWIAASGRFDAAKLSRFARARGGRCVRGMCTLQGSAPERQISWLEPESGLLVLAVSTDPLAAALGGSRRLAPLEASSSPVWLHVPGAQLAAREGLPPGVSSLLSALSGAREATFSAALDSRGLAVSLTAPFANPGDARASAGRLVSATGLLRKLIEREKVVGRDAGLAEVLASGEFRAEDSTVRGSWRVSQSWLSQLTP
jgi:hypothetical protein